MYSLSSCSIATEMPVANKKSASQHLDKHSSATRKSEGAPCFVPINNVLQANPDVIRLRIHNVTLSHLLS